MLIIKQPSNAFYWQFWANNVPACNIAAAVGLLECPIQSNHVVKQFGFMKRSIASVEQIVHPVVAYLHRGKRWAGCSWPGAADVVQGHSEVSRATKVWVRGHVEVTTTFQQRQTRHVAQWITQREEQYKASCNTPFTHWLGTKPQI